MIKEIIDNGYDQNEFSIFMQNRWEFINGGNLRASVKFKEALDIDKWTFELLEKAVRDYQDLMKDPNMKE